MVENLRCRDFALSLSTPRGVFLRVQEAVLARRFGLRAFLIPLIVRALPEIIVGPYPVGFDTIAFYVPTTLDWAAEKARVLEMLGTVPL